MTTSKKTVLAAILAASLPAGLAYAGYKQHQSFGQVTLYPKAAYGQLGAARNSPNEHEFIGCHVYTEIGKKPYGHCRAQDAERKQVQCGTYDPELVTAIRSLGTDSAIGFGWGEPGECTWISVATYSHDEPKNP